MKKICLILTAFLLLFPLVACGSKPKEVEVPKEVAEFFTNRKGEENAQILVDALVTNPEQTSAGPSPATIEKYVAFGNAFMMIMDCDYKFEPGSEIHFCKGDYTDNLKEAAKKFLPYRTSSQTNELEDGRLLFYCIGTGLFENDEDYSLVYKKGDEVSVTTWKMEVKGEYYTVELDDSSGGKAYVSPIGISVDLYIKGEVSLEKPFIKVYSEKKEELESHELSEHDYEQQEILGESFCNINAIPNKGAGGDAVVDLTCATEITIFDRTFKLDKVN